MDQVADIPIRRVEPLPDLEETFATLLSEADEPDTAERCLLVNPITRRLMQPWIPLSLADELKLVFEQIAEKAARDAREERRVEATSEAREIAGDLRMILSEATNVADSLRTLARLFFRAIEEEGQHLVSASHLVSDVMVTMADRLDAFDARATALYAPLVTEFSRR